MPALSSPKFLGVSEVGFLADNEPVIAFVSGEEARAYPLQILIWHEIVNDVVDGKPVTITFCPLCNTAVAFDRVVAGEELEFRVSGLLRNSDLIMYDVQTESWWQQATGEGIVGRYTGFELESLPVTIIAWEDFKAAFPDGVVLSRDTGYQRDYGSNPYVGYDDIDSSPFLFKGTPDGRLAAMERVATVRAGNEVVAYPYSRLETARVVHDRIGGEPVVVLFKPGTLSVLDSAAISQSEEVGSAAVFSAIVDGRELSFRADGDTFADSQTGTRWDILGRGVSGAMKGRVLTPVVSGTHFWFAWAAFQPETRIWSP
ncbi:MAG: DUF3179 domain-containing protein [Dehalococcoidia bacterium]